MNIINIIKFESQVAMMVEDVKNYRIDIRELGVVEMKKNASIIVKKPVSDSKFKKMIFGLLERSEEYLEYLECSDAEEAEMLVMGYEVELKMKEMLKEMYNRYRYGNRKSCDGMVAGMCIFKLRRKGKITLEEAIVMLERDKRLPVSDIKEEWQLND